MRHTECGMLTEVSHSEPPNVGSPGASLRFPSRSHIEDMHALAGFNPADHLDRPLGLQLGSGTPPAGEGQHVVVAAAQAQASASSRPSSALRALRQRQALLLDIQQRDPGSPGECSGIGEQTVGNVQRGAGLGAQFQAQRELRSRCPSSARSSGRPSPPARHRPVISCSAPAASPSGPPTQSRSPGLAPSRRSARPWQPPMTVRVETQGAAAGSPPINASRRSGPCGRDHGEGLQPGPDRPPAGSARG